MMRFVKGGLCALAVCLAGSSYAHAGTSPDAVPASPGFVKKAMTMGPWGYGCVYPGKASPASATICTVGRAFAIGKTP
ncbi:MULTISPECIES: hypothetical protein [Bombella]|uniref:Porin n=1 Tax=Bombella saccharophila TaxID=2967338 RepID=A0ABT3W9X8_9PROT|nr:MULTISPECIES: hypothetical protein [Bombella]MCX5613796.1 hypothetical protein [Bombella saccharophila]MUG04334.1 hypothetical protein [Bombella sp. ESL0378]